MDFLDELQPIDGGLPDLQRQRRAEVGDQRDRRDDRLVERDATHPTAKGHIRDVRTAAARLIGDIDDPGASPTFLAVYRDRDNAVGFLEINPVTKRLLELVDEDTGASGESLLSRIATEMNHPEPKVVIKGGAEILNNLHQKDIILGTKQQ